jgi:CRISPR-associated protein (TIGR03986 family)
MPCDDGAARLPDGLGDVRPPGHHRWHPGRWSGEIAVTLRVVTPLLLMRERTTNDSGAEEDREDGHRHLVVATTPDGLVDLAPTQLKGMLRSVYEVVTNSRFGVFQHDDRLGHRQPADGRANLRPAIVESADRVLLPGDLVRGETTFEPVVKVRAWAHAGEERTWLHREFAHGDEVDAVIRLVGRGWRVESLHRPGEATGAPGHYVVRGRLHAPGPTIKGKHSERLFVTEVIDGDLTQKQSRVVTVPDSKSLVDELHELVAHQRSIHRSAGSDDVWAGKEPWEYAGHEPGRTAWSRHLYQSADPDGAGGAPAWVGPDTRVPPPPGEVLTCWFGTGPDRLQPVMIGRSLYQNPPGKLLHESLHPAPELDGLSPADRVFGWAWQRRQGDDEADQRPSPSAHRGQLRVVRVQAPAAADAVEKLAPLTIAPLSTPKPSQGRFYLGEKKRDGAVGPLPPRTSRAQFFDPRKQALRGRKVYPHHRGLEGLGLTQLRDRFDYDLTKPTGRPLQDSQNATLHGWVRPGVEFTFVVQVSDLHALELGALLWLLDPVLSGKSGMRARHRLGMGKPLGFGSVELSVRADGTHLYTGEQMVARLEALADRPEPVDWSRLAEDFEEAMSQRFDSVLAAVRTALVGFAGNHQVHYPRTGDQQPIYEWFTENEKGKKQPLPLLGKGQLPDDPGA